MFARIGKVGVWSEPCCGTAVTTLNNPEPAAREVICDLNAFICNYYRAVRGDYRADRLLVGLADEPPRLDGASQVAAGAGAGAERAHGERP